MNYEKRFLEIRDFLKNHSYLHEIEMLERNEKVLKPPYDKWSKDLSQLSFEEQRLIENNYSTDKITSSDLEDFIKTAKSLIQIPKKKISESLIPGNLSRKLSLKKHHEIAMIKSLLDDEKIESFIDIGSGAAHLSSCLVSSTRKSICIDSNHKFQESGKKKLKRWAPEKLDKIEFVTKTILNQNDLKEFHLTKSSMLLGLHSCGPLSSNLIQLQHPRLLNIGCCYHKLKNEYNLSNIAKSDPLWFTNHALTSAAKGYAIHSRENYDKKIKVKKYRYTLHFLLKEKLGNNFKALGNAKMKDYCMPFHEYCYKYAPESKSFTKEEILKFSLEKRDFIHYTISAGVLRSLLGRLIELYIILDRALYLTENQIDAKIFELFDRKLSPRNILIYA